MTQEFYGMDQKIGFWFQQKKIYLQIFQKFLKKGCPFNFNTLEKNNSINSTYNGIAFTADMMDDNPDKVRLLALRSFGESLHHSITDASLEFGFKSI